MRCDARAVWAGREGSTAWLGCWNKLANRGSLRIDSAKGFGSMRRAIGGRIKKGGIAIR